LAPSEPYNQEQGRRHKTLLDWARQMILQIRVPTGYQRLVFVGDGAFSCIDFLHAVAQQVTFITRFRPAGSQRECRALPPIVDGVEPASERTPEQVGRPRKKGKRLPTLKQILDDPTTAWTMLRVGTAIKIKRLHARPARGSGIKPDGTSGTANPPCRFVGSGSVTPRVNSIPWSFVANDIDLMWLPERKLIQRFKITSKPTDPDF
jgi:hypothetical protein